MSLSSCFLGIFARTLSRRNALFRRNTFCGPSRWRFFEHAFYHLVQLLTVFHFLHQRLRGPAITNNPDGRRMFHPNPLAQAIVGLHFFSQFAIGVVSQWYGSPVLFSKLLHQL